MENSEIIVAVIVLGILVFALFRGRGRVGGRAEGKIIIAFIVATVVMIKGCVS